MSIYNQFQESYGDDGRVIINNFGTILYVAGNQDNSVNQVVNASTSQPNALQRRGLQRVHDAVVIIAKYMPVAVGFIYYLITGVTPFL